MSSPQFNGRSFGVLSLSHLVNDMYTNFLPQLIPFLIAARGYTVFAGATLVTAFTLSSSLLQPFFGYLVDQKGQRWLVYVGTLWMALLLGVTGLIPGYPLLLVISIMAGLGTSAFHPQAMAMVGQVAGDRKGFLLGAFIAAGNLGLAVSPLVLLPLFDYYGYSSTWVVIIPGLLVTLMLYRYAPESEPHIKPAQGLKQALGALKNVSADLYKLMTVVALRSLVHSGLMMLLPLYLMLNRKFSAENTGYLVFATLATGALGGLIGGYISDRYGRKPLIVVSLALSALLFYGFLYTGGALSFILLSLGGMTLLSSFSVTVAAAQEVIPENKALASGLSLGFAIGMGGLAVTPVGKFADIFGVDAAVKLVFSLPLAAALIGLYIREAGQKQSLVNAVPGEVKR